MATRILVGPTGVNDAAGYLGLTMEQFSNACGEEAQIPVGEAALRDPDMVGVPAGPPRARREKVKFVPNMLRKAVEELWGHPYGYFDALKANDLEERHVLFKGQRIVIPARGRRAKMAQAAKWRRRLGSS